MSRDMTVMILGSGKSYHSTRWANALVDAGISVTFVTVHRVRRPLNDSVEVVELPAVGKISYLHQAPRVRALVKQVQPDVLHSHSAGGYGFLGRACGYVPWIVSVYGWDVYDVPLRSPLHRAVKFLLRRPNRVLATSHAMADQVKAVYPDLPRPSVTPFGVDTDLFSPGPSKEGTGEQSRVGS